MAYAPNVDVELLVGVAVVQMLNPGAVKTCQEYADTLSLPYVFQQLSSAKRVDVVCMRRVHFAKPKRCDQAEKKQRY